MDRDNAKINLVKRFWEANPLGSLESSYEIGSCEFFNGTIKSGTEMRESLQAIYMNLINIIVNWFLILVVAMVG